MWRSLTESAGSNEKRSSSAGLRALSGAILCLVAVTAIYQVIATRHVNWNGGCGDDGSLYCSMAQGGVIGEPGSWRALLPLLIRSLNVQPDNLPEAFLVINLLSLGVMAALTGVLTFRLTQRMQQERNQGIWAAILAGALLLLLPMGFRWTWFYPVLVDNFSGALALGWFLLNDSERLRQRLLGIPLAPMAVLTKESWMFVILAVVLVGVFLQRRRQELLIGGITTISLIGAWVVIRIVPTTGSGPTGFGSPAYVRSIVTLFFTTSVGLKHLFWMAFFSIGTLPVLFALNGSSWGKIVREKRQARRLILASAAAGISQAVVGMLGGADFHRYLFAAAPFIIGPLTAHVAGHPRLRVHFFAFLVVSLLVWRPFHALDGTRMSYLTFYSPNYISDDLLRSRFLRDTRLAVTFMVGWAAVVGSRQIVLRASRR